MLGRQDHRVHAHGIAVLVILHRHLGLAVRPQIIHQLLLAHLGQASRHLMGQGNGQGHLFGRLVAGVAEHHALIARAADLVVGAQGDVAGLLVDVDKDAAGVAVKAVLRPIIADLADDLAGNLLDIDIAVRADLTHDVHEARRGRRLAGDAPVGILLEDGVQHRIGNLVADFIRMPLGDRLGSKEIVTHSFSPFLLSARRKMPRTHPGHGKTCCQASSFVSPPDLAPCMLQVAGLHRAVPSTALDKVFNCTCIISAFLCLSSQNK